MTRAEYIAADSQIDTPYERVSIIQLDVSNHELHVIFCIPEVIDMYVVRIELPIHSDVDSMQIDVEQFFANSRLDLEHDSKKQLVHATALLYGICCNDIPLSIVH